MKYEYSAIEYTELYDKHKGIMINALNAMGKDGWELCFMNGQLLVFKRQLPLTIDIKKLSAIDKAVTRLG